MSHVTNKSLFRWIAGGVAAAALIAAVAIALWPTSAEDTARSDGKKVGHAVSYLYYAQNADQVEAARDDLFHAVSDSRRHASSEIDQQVDKQADALNRAVDGFVGSRTTGDAFEADLYQSELDYALDDLASQANDFRTHGPAVVQAFWDGVDDGLAVDR